MFKPYKTDNRPFMPRHKGAIFYFADSSTERITDKSLFKTTKQKYFLPIVIYAEIFMLIS